MKKTSKMIRLVRYISVAILLFTTLLTGSAGVVSAHQENTVSGDQDATVRFTSQGHVLTFENDSMMITGDTHMLRTDFIGADPAIPVRDEDDGTGATRVSYKDLWPGVDLEYVSNDDILIKSTYYLNNGQAAGNILLGYNRPVSIDSDGNLKIVFETGVLTEAAPVAWQVIDGVQADIAVSFTIRSDREVGFSLGDHVPGVPVVIDPVTTWNSFLGSTANDEARAIAVDSSGNVYVSGTSSATWGSPVRSFTVSSGKSDVFVAKLDSSGSLVWNTFLGGSESDIAKTIALDASGNVYVGGYSNKNWGSPDNSYTSDAYGGFIVKLNGSGVLQWHTIVDAEVYGTVLDSSGNVYFSGRASATWGTPVRAFGGGPYDAVIMKLDTDGASVWHTFLGGTSGDYGQGLTLDSSGNVHVAGYSYAAWGSPSGSLTFKGAADGFVAQLDTSGNLVWNQFCGTAAGTDTFESIAVDSSGNVYASGSASAVWNHLFTVKGAFYGGTMATILKLNSSGTYVWHAYVGGTGYDRSAYGANIDIDSSDNLYLTGVSTSTWGSPVRAFTAPDVANDGDAFVVKMDTSGNKIWSTFLGGAGNDESFSLVTDASGNTYSAGLSYKTWGTPVEAYPGGLYDSNAYVVSLDTTGALIEPAEMSIEGNSTGISSGDSTPSSDDHTDFGSTDIDSGTVVRTFTIKNTGGSSLTLTNAPTAVSLSGTNAADFSVTQQPSSPVSASGSTTFTITFNPSASGTRTATVSIANSDSDENPYTFAIQGYGTKTLTISGVGAADKVYDGTDAATLDTDSATLVGVDGGDTVVLEKGSASGTFSSAAVGASKTVTTSGFSLSGTDAGKYTLTQPSTTASITARSIAVTADAKSKTYGASDPTLTYQVTSGTLVSGDSFSGSITRDAGESVGQYDITQGTLSLSSNYSLTYTSAKLTITAKAITVTADAQSKNYGDRDPMLTYQVTSGTLESGDSFSGSITRDAGESVGQYDITQGDLALSTNYSLTYVSAKLTISAKAITVVADAKSKTYGESDPTLTYQVTSGTLEDGDSFSGAITRDAGESTGQYDITQGTLALSTNYSLTYTSAKLTINAKAITVTAEADTKTYDGTTSSSGTPTITSGSLVSGDTVTWTQSFADKNVGTGKTITPSGTVSDGNSGNNYAVTFVNNTSGVITVRAITVTADAKSKTYGASDPTLTYQVSSGSLASGDSFSGSMTRDAGESVGQYDITQGTLALSTNYSLTYVSAKLTISAKSITVTADAKSKTYGDADPTLTYQVTSGTLESGDSFSGAITRDAGESAGQYDITQGTLALSSNYSLTYTSAKLTINAKAITVTAAADTKTYDGTTSSSGTPTITSGSLVSGDTVTWTQSFANKDAGTGKTIVPSGTVSDGNSGNNYTVTFVNNTSGVVTAKAITVTADAESKTYGDADPTLTYQVTSGSLVSGDSFSGAITRDAGESVGQYDITQGTLALSANYNLTYTGAKLTITAKAIAVTADAKSKTYGDADPTLTYQVTSGSLVSGDSFSGSMTRAAGESTGQYNITQGTLALSANYNLTYTGAKLTVTAKAITVTAAADTKTYDGTTASSQTPTITSGSLVSGDTVTWSQTFDNKNVGTGKTIVPSGTISDGNSGNNYAVTFVNNTSGAITAKQLTVTGITADDKSYDGTPTAILNTGGAALVGIVSGDAVTLNVSGATGMFSDAAIGTGKTVTVSGLTLGGTDGGNYQIAAPTTTADIIVAASGGGGGAPVVQPQPDPEPDPEPEPVNEDEVVFETETVTDPVAKDTQGNTIAVTGTRITVNKDQEKLTVTIPVDLGSGTELDSFTDAAGITYQGKRMEIPTSSKTADGKSLLTVSGDDADLGGSITIETGDVVSSGDKAVAEVVSIKTSTGATSKDLTNDVPSLGKVSSSINLDLKTIPNGASVKITTSRTPDPAADSAFQLAATSASLGQIEVAYSINVEKTSLTNGTDIQSAAITMAVGRQWIDERGGTEGVRIIRFDPETGTQQVLETRFVGYDEDGRAVFEGISPDGLSVFGLAFAKPVTETEATETVEEPGQESSETAVEETPQTGETPEQAESEAVSETEDDTAITDESNTAPDETEQPESDIAETEETAGDKGITWWTWLIIGIAAVVVTGAVYLFLVRRRV